MVNVGPYYEIRDGIRYFAAVNDNVSPEKAPAYVVYSSGGSYYAVNGHTGAIDYSGAAAAAVIQAAINALTGGRTWKETVALKGSFPIKTAVSLPSYTVLDCTGARLINTVDSTTKGRIVENTGDRHIELVGGIYLGSGYVSETVDDDAALIYLGAVTWLTLSKLYVADTVNRGVLIQTSGTVKVSNIVTRHCGSPTNRMIGFSITNCTDVTGTNIIVTECHSDFALALAQITSGAFSALATYLNDRVGTEIAYNCLGVTINGLASRQDKTGLYFKYGSKITVNGYSYWSTIASNVGIVFDSVTEAKEDITINGFAIDCGSADSGMALTGKMDLCKRIKLIHGVVENVYYAGVSFHEAATVGDDLTVEDVTFYNINTNAFINQYCLRTSMTNSKIRGCTFHPVNAIAYGIYMRTGGTGGTIMENVFQDAYGTATIQQDAVGHRIRDNTGYVTENSGTSTGTGAQQTIAHGLALAPTRVFFSEFDTGLAIAYQSAAADAANIYVTAVLNKTYNWYAEVGI